LWQDDGANLDVIKCHGNQTYIEVVAVRNPLEYVTVAVSKADDVNSKPAITVQALKDSGAEMAVVSEKVMEQLGEVVPMGMVKLSGIGGHSLECLVVRLFLRILEDGRDILSYPGCQAFVCNLRSYEKLC